jgi:hypothetical protein
VGAICVAGIASADSAASVATASDTGARVSTSSAAATLAVFAASDAAFADESTRDQHHSSVCADRRW